VPTWTDLADATFAELLGTDLTDADWHLILSGEGFTERGIARLQFLRWLAERRPSTSDLPRAC
jgi:hypothetical protein